MTLPGFVFAGAVWLGLYAAFGQPILIGVGLLCLALVGYEAWGSRKEVES